MVHPGRVHPPNDARGRIVGEGSAPGRPAASRAATFRAGAPGRGPGALVGCSAVGKRGYVRAEDTCVVFVRGGRGRLRHRKFHPATVPYEGIVGVELRPPRGARYGELWVHVLGYSAEEAAAPDYPFRILFGAWQLASMRKVHARIRRSAAIAS